VAGRLALRLMARVVVIGSGLAGLAAAARLASAGHSMIVLEAREEIGGRTRSRRLDGDVLELGGQFVSRHHLRIRRMASEARLRLERDRFALGPVRWRTSDAHASRLRPPARPGDVVAAARLVVGLRRLGAAASGRVERSEPRMAELDRRSVADWLHDAGPSPPLRHAIESALGQLFSTDLAALSLLQLGEFVDGIGGALAVLRSGLGLDCHLAEGTSALCAYLAQGLNEPVRTGKSVVGVDQTSSIVGVRCADGEVVECDYAIVAVPLPLVNRLVFDPPLCASVAGATAAIRFGRATKVAAVVGARGPVQARSFLGGAGLTAGWRTRRVLYGLAVGDASDYASRELIDDLCAGFAVAPERVEHAEVVRWAQDEFALGTYVHFAPGQRLGCRAELTRPHGRVYFAAAERSSWPIHMEGAVESGSDAAESILTHIS
jgi:monoamine oxidase